METKIFHRQERREGSKGKAARTALAAGTALGLIAWVPEGSSLAAAPPEKIDLDDPSHIIVSETVIPIPLEIFASLDKLGEQNWAEQVDLREIKVNTNRSRSAMLFGLVVSDGFIAVQAKDRESVKRIGREVLHLSKVLGVSGEVEGHAHAIVTGADRGDWASVRRELDRTRQTVLNRMRKNRDELTSLVSLGGWLGGTRALASVIEGNYTLEGSDLLHQPELVKQLREDFEELPRKSRRGSVFAKVGRTLTDLEQLMRTDGSGGISEQSVHRISSETSELVDAIYGS